MRRLLRHVFTVCSALSLLLCVAVCVWWVRSYFRAHTVYHLAAPQAWSLSANHGRLSLGRREYYGLQVPEPVWMHHSSPCHGIWRYGKPTWSLAGFERAEVPWTPQFDYCFRDTYWTVPDWFVVGVAMILPAVWGKGWYRQRRSERRRMSGRCGDCGYDLRAHAAGGRCPECAREIHRGGGGAGGAGGASQPPPRAL